MYILRVCKPRQYKKQVRYSKIYHETALPWYRKYSGQHNQCDIMYAWRMMERLFVIPLNIYKDFPIFLLAEFSRHDIILCSLHVLPTYRTEHVTFWPTTALLLLLYTLRLLHALRAYNIVSDLPYARVECSEQGSKWLLPTKRERILCA